MTSEEKNKKALPSILLGISIIIIIVLSILLYNKSKVTCEDTNKTQNNNTNTSIKDNKASDVSANDKYVSHLGISNDTIIYQSYMIDNGKLYYYIINDKIYDGNYSNHINYLMDDTNSNLNEYMSLKNIKRIKGTNTVSNGEDFNILAITEEGKVYSIHYNSENQNLIQNEDETFKDYKVDDIIKYDVPSGCIDGMECKTTFKIKTTDGKLIEK